jgi:hypothetical protein
LEVLQWAHENGCPWDEWTCSAAAEGGQFEILQWAREQGCPWDAGNVCLYATFMEHLEIVQWVKEQMSLSKA